MKKTVLAFFCSLFFLSCDYDVANNARMEFTGTVTDQTGNPIPEIFVYLEGVDGIEGFFYPNEQSENLGENYTDNSGNLRVVSLKTSTNIFHINRPEDSYFHYNNDTFEIYSEPTNSEFTCVDYVNVPGSMDFGTVKLHKKAELILKINKTSTADVTLSWNLSYTHATCYYVFDRSFLLEEESSCHENFPDNFYPQQQNASQPNFEDIYHTIVGGRATFTYQIDDQPEQNISLNFDEPHETFVFEY